MPPTPPRSPLFPYTTLFRSPRPPARNKSGADGRRARASGSGRRWARIARPCSALHACATRQREQVLDVLQVGDRKSTRLNSSHLGISYAVFCLKKKKTKITI